MSGAAQGRPRSWGRPCGVPGGLGPGPGARGLIQATGAQGRQPRPSGSAYRSRSSTLRTFPDTVIGKESRTLSRVGTL